MVHLNVSEMFDQTSNSMQCEVVKFMPESNIITDRIQTEINNTYDVSIFIRSGDFDYNNRDSEIVLMSFTAKNPGNGEGTKALKGLIQLAKAEGFTRIWVEACPLRSNHITTAAQLAKWYMRHGFVDYLNEFQFKGDESELYQMRCNLNEQ